MHQTKQRHQPKLVEAIGMGKNALGFTHTYVPFLQQFNPNDGWLEPWCAETYHYFIGGFILCLYVDNHFSMESTLLVIRIITYIRIISGFHTE